MTYLNLIEQEFPNLKNSYYKETSKATSQYNCIAWAININNKRYWPNNIDYFWPDNISNSQKIESFIKLFNKEGYYQCDDSEYEEGFEKICLYTLNNVPKHAARQTKNGNWTSKLGDEIDIEHTITGLVGNWYGNPTLFFKKKL